MEEYQSQQEDKCFKKEECVETGCFWNSKDNTYFIKQNGKKTNFAIDTYTKNKKLMGNYIINEFFTIPPKFSI